MWDSVINDIVNIKAFKHNGTLYRQLTGNKVLFQNDEYTLVLSIMTKVEELNGQKWYCKDPVLWWFFKNKFYNFSVTVRDGECFFYVNLASPAIISNNSIRYIDYDLDIKKSNGVPAKVLDKKEFDKNKKLFKYDPKLIKIIDKSLRDLVKMMNEEIEPFKKDYVKELVDNLIKNHNYPKNKRVKIRQTPK